MNQERKSMYKTVTNGHYNQDDFFFQALTVMKSRTSLLLVCRTLKKLLN
jgi:hypothetical protein